MMIVANRLAAEADEEREECPTLENDRRTPELRQAAERGQARPQHTESADPPPLPGSLRGSVQ
jgi:hypothetical protein